MYEILFMIVEPLKSEFPTGTTLTDGGTGSIFYPLKNEKTKVIILLDKLDTVNARNIR